MTKNVCLIIKLIDLFNKNVCLINQAPTQYKAIPMQYELSPHM